MFTSTRAAAGSPENTSPPSKKKRIQKAGIIHVVGQGQRWAAHHHRGHSPQEDLRSIQGSSDAKFAENFDWSEVVRGLKINPVSPVLGWIDGAWLSDAVGLPEFEARLRVGSVKLLLENLPPSLRDRRQTLAKCLEAMDRVRPVRAVYLFGSHARGEARVDSDVDLCIVTEAVGDHFFRTVLEEGVPLAAED